MSARVRAFAVHTIPALHLSACCISLIHSLFLPIKIASASSGSACELEKNVAISPSGDCGDGSCRVFHARSSSLEPSARKVNDRCGVACIGTNTFGGQKCTTKSHGFSTTDFGSVINAKSATLEITKANCKVREAMTTPPFSSPTKTADIVTYS